MGQDGDDTATPSWDPPDRTGGDGPVEPRDPHRPPRGAPGDGDPGDQIDPAEPVRPDAGPHVVPEGPHVPPEGPSDDPVAHDGPGRRRLLVASALALALALVVGVVVALSGDSGSDTLAPGVVTTTPRTTADPAREADVDATAPVTLPTATTSVARPTTTDPSSTTTAAPAEAIDDVDDPTGGDGGPPATAPEQDEDAPSVVARPIPVDPPPPPPSAPAPPWAMSRVTTPGGHLSTGVGCAADGSPAALDAFFAARVGPVLGWDYQHVYPLGDGRQLWLFQDTFIDQSGTATTLDRANFVHNSALVQEGACFRLLHGGTAAAPTPFEPGTGTRTLSTWFWPMGGEMHDGRLYVFWAEMRKDSYDPRPPDGLGWHPVATHVGVYDPATMARLDFRPAPNAGVRPIYGYAVASDATHTYLFGNTFEQNMVREGGWFNGPHSATQMFLARVPRGQLLATPEYWRPEGWDRDPAGAQPYLRRHWAEFPMQPRFVDGQWVAVTAVDGYWGDSFEVDVARQPWGPWTNVERRGLPPRGGDPKMNTYHAHLVPGRATNGDLVVSVSNNARDMLKDAWPTPSRYRPEIFRAAFRVAPAPPPPPTPPATTAPVTTAAPPTTATPTTARATTTTTTTARTTTTTAATTTTTATTTATTRPATTAPVTTAAPPTTRPTTSSSVTTTTTTPGPATTTGRSGPTPSTPAADP